MNPTFRYRTLTSSLNHEEVERLADELGTYHHGGRRKDYARAELEAVRDIEASEHSATEQELAQMLRSGEVLPSDLVLSGGCWTTFDRSPEFYEHCEPGDDGARRGASVSPALVKYVISIGLVIAYAVIRFSH